MQDKNSKDTQEVIKTDWKNDLEVITENTKDKWSWEYRGCNGFMGDFEDFVERQVKEIRNIVKEKNGSVSDEVNEVLDTYEMEHKLFYILSLLEIIKMMVSTLLSVSLLILALMKSFQ